MALTAPADRVVLLDPGLDPEAVDPAGRVFRTGDRTLVGPFAEGAGCGRCLVVRWSGTHLPSAGAGPRPGSPPVGSAPLVADLLRTVRPRPGTAVVVVLEDGDPRPRTVHLLPVPGCSGCAPFPAPAPGSGPRQPVRGYRTRGPQDVGLPSTALVNTELGLLGRRWGTDVTSPTAVPAGGAFPAVGARGPVEITWGGQGATVRASRLTGLLEGLERHAGTDVRHGGRVRHSSLRALGRQALDVTALGVTVVPGARFRTEEGLPALPEDAVVAWVPARSLVTGRERWIPKQLAHYHAPDAHPGFVQESSSGCASGTGEDEAALHALLELVERDAFLLSWYRGLDLPEVDLSTVADTTLRHTVRRAEFLGFEVRAFDGRVDLPFPVVVCTTERHDGGPGAFNVAAAASLDPLAALRSAVSEITARSPVLAEECAADPVRLERLAADASAVRTLSDHSVLAGSPGFARHVRGLLTRRRRYPLQHLFGPARHDGDVPGALRHVVTGLVTAGFEPWVVDQTTDEQAQWGLRTVRAVVPGLIPIDFGWHRQRALTSPRLATAHPTASPVRLPRPPASHRRLVPHPFP
ncbi:YcaO-like family protein [Kineococcus sp. LSe6-4]|uniref:YcaO-like family protein n=1 Tax=Kineococcus halophytocola TaxID=3234027 RepID=A0ABV4H542_9ACTN